MRNLCSQSRIHHVVRKSIGTTRVGREATFGLLISIDVINIICTKFVMGSPIKIQTTLMTVAYENNIVIRPTYFVLQCKVTV